MSLPTINQYEITLLAKRLLLTPIVGSNAEAMYPILSDRRLYEFTGDQPPESVEALQAWFSRLETRISPDESQLWLTWLVRIAEDDSAIGYVQATVTESHTDIAWLIGSEWQGNGYASEATNKLVSWLISNGVKTIRACINPTHRASQLVATKANLSNSCVVEDGEEVWILRC